MKWWQTTSDHFNFLVKIIHVLTEKYQCSTVETIYSTTDSFVDLPYKILNEIWSKDFAQLVSSLLQPGQWQNREELSIKNLIMWYNDPETCLEKL